MSGFLRFVLFAFVVGSMAGCGRSHYVIEGAEQAYLLTNMHLDSRGNVSSVMHTTQPNGTLLPVCTPVRIDRVNAREIRFTTNTDGVRHRYVRHRSSRAPIEQHLARYFGGQCPNVQSFTPEDQAGIAQGQIYQGMTKQGVIVAMGYPPEHRTPSLEEDVWRYWTTRHRTMEVFFSNNVVSGIRQ